MEGPPARVNSAPFLSSPTLQQMMAAEKRSSRKAAEGEPPMPQLEYVPPAVVDGVLLGNLSSPFSPQFEANLRFVLTSKAAARVRMKDKFHSVRSAVTAVSHAAAAHAEEVSQVLAVRAVKVSVFNQMLACFLGRQRNKPVPGPCRAVEPTSPLGPAMLLPNHTQLPDINIPLSDAMKAEVEVDVQAMLQVFQGLRAAVGAHFAKQAAADASGRHSLATLAKKDGVTAALAAAASLTKLLVSEREGADTVKEWTSLCGQLKQQVSEVQQVTAEQPALVVTSPARQALLPADKASQDAQDDAGAATQMQALGAAGVFHTLGELELDPGEEDVALSGRQMQEDGVNSGLCGDLGREVQGDPSVHSLDWAAAFSAFAAGIRTSENAPQPDILPSGPVQALEGGEQVNVEMTEEEMALAATIAMLCRALTASDLVTAAPPAAAVPGADAAAGGSAALAPLAEQAAAPQELRVQPAGALLPGAEPLSRRVTRVQNLDGTFTIIGSDGHKYQENEARVRRTKKREDKQLAWANAHPVTAAPAKLAAQGTGLVVGADMASGSGGVASAVNTASGSGGGGSGVVQQPSQVEVHGFGSGSEGPRKPMDAHEKVTVQWVGG